MFSKKYKERFSVKTLGEDYLFYVSVMFWLQFFFYEEFINIPYKDSGVVFNFIIIITVYGIWRGFSNKHSVGMDKTYGKIALLLISVLNVFALLDITDQTNLDLFTTIIAYINLGAVLLFIVFFIKSDPEVKIQGNMGRAYLVALIAYIIGCFIYFRFFTEVTWGIFYSTTTFFLPIYIWVTGYIFNLFMNGKKKEN